MVNEKNGNLKRKHKYKTFGHLQIYAKSLNPDVIKCFQKFLPFNSTDSLRKLDE